MKARTIGIVLVAGYLLCGFIDPADGAELYAQTGLAYQVPHGRCDGNGICRWDRNDYSAALAHIEIGLSQTAGRWTGSLYARHESLAACHDFGVNQIGASLRVTLWRTK
jgi:hypothetical protein